MDNNEKFKMLVLPCGLRRLLPLLLAVVLAACGMESAGPALTDEDIVLNNRGVALMGHFDYPGAQAAFAKLVERQPDWHDGRTNLAIAHMNRQQPDDGDLALQQLAIVLAARPDDLRANYVAGLLRLYIGEVEAAASHFEVALAGDADDAYAHYYFGQSHLRMGDDNTALAAWERSIEIDPYLRSAYYSAAQVLQRLDRDDEAREQIAVFQRFANNPSARLAEFKYTRMGPLSLALVVNDEVEPDEIPDRPEGALFQDTMVVGRLDSNLSSTHLSTVDFDQNGSQDLLLASTSAASRLMLAGSDSEFAGMLAPWSDIGGINAVAWGDVDNNGFVDAYLCRSGPNQLWTQSAAGAWQQVGEAANAGDGNNDCADATMVDADHDGDLDVLVANRGAGDSLLNNNFDGNFRSLADSIGAAAEIRDTHSVITADIDADLDVDIVFLHDAPPHTVLINDRQWNYAPAQGLDDFISAHVQALAVIDLDTDGQNEFIGVGADGQVNAWKAGNDGQWAETSVYRSQLAGDAAIDVAALDLSGDGRVELVLLTAGAFEVVALSSDGQGTQLALESFDGGIPIPVLRSATEGNSLIAVAASAEHTDLLEWPPGPGRFAFAALALTGKHDDANTMRSNASGIGTLISLRNGSRWSLTNTYKHASLRGHSLQPVSIGLGGASRADYVALDWSDGVFQTELDVESGSIQHIAEIERQMGSCPVLFAWNGDHFAFVTDLLGVGAMGFFIEPGVSAPPRPWERLAFAPGRLQSNDGRLMFKLTEPMEENAYVDAMTLESYDLPPEWRIAVDERFATAAPAVTGETLFYQASISPISARDSGGDDVLPLIAEQDGRAMSPGEFDRRFIGLLKKPESLTLEFAAPLNRLSDRPGAVPVLLADSWIEFPYSQTAFAAWQAGREYQSTTLEARDGEGVWHTIYPGFGFPAGMPRETALPLHDLPPATDAIRLSWNRETYWDRIRIVYAEPAPDNMQHIRYTPRFARVANSGFAKRIMHAQRRQEYDYRQRAPFRDTKHPTGFYTHTGEMTELVAATDDALAIIGPGEEVHVEFDAATEPSPGLQRWYVLETRGWGKDNDLYTEHGDTVGPLPRAYADADAERRELLHRQYNGRFQSGQ